VFYFLAFSLRRYRFIAQRVISIKLIFLLVFSGSVFSDDSCTGFYQEMKEQFPDYAYVAGWGVKVSDLVFHEQSPGMDFQMRRELEYEYDERIVYDEEPVSIAHFWQGCESYIGEQDSCYSDFSFSLVNTPDQLNVDLESQGSPINSEPLKTIDFPNSLNGDQEESIFSNVFNASLSKTKIEELGSFKQFSNRQAIRYTWDVHSSPANVEFDRIQLPIHSFGDNGLFINTKIIFKFGYLLSGEEEPVYIANRVLLNSAPREIVVINAFDKEEDEVFIEHNEFLSDDYVSVDQLLKNIETMKEMKGSFSQSMCGTMEIARLGSNSFDNYNNYEADKLVFHFEMQTSIINSKEVEDFDPGKYMDRDLTLPPKKDAGSLHYLLLFGAFAFFRRKQTIKAQQ